MGRIAAMGDWRRIQAFAVAGVDARPVAGDAEAVAAWDALPPEVSVLILTPAAAQALGGRLEERRDLLVTVLE